MFNDDVKTPFLTRFFFLLKTGIYYHLVFKKKFSLIEVKPRIMGIRNIAVFGPNIELCGSVIMFASDGGRTTISTVKMNGHEGRISFGDNVLVMNGVRINSASEIIIGDDCMLANFCYIMDADWHDIYDRSNPVGKTRPVVLEKNVWVGDSAIICKGVTIGENSIIGAGAVVTGNIPPNVIAAGNPARVVKKLDPHKIVTRERPGKKLR